MQEPLTHRPKVYIVIYSLYHHIYKLALVIREELVASGIDAQIFQVPETLSDPVLEKMHAPAKPDVPTIQVNQLAEPDGLMFGIPTRFGIFPAQIKTLLDASGQLWAKGSLAGKFAATFFSTASQHGGQETTALNAVTYFAHHGLLYVPFGFANASLFDNGEVVGGSAYGAGTITNGDGSRQPSEQELDIAKNQAANFAKLLNQYQRGKFSRIPAPPAAAATALPDDVPIESTNSGAANGNMTGATTAGAAVATGAAAGTAAAAAAAAPAVAEDTATTTAANRKNPASTGADSDASIRSLKAASSQNQSGNNRDMPVITTTNPEGFTEQQQSNAIRQSTDTDGRDVSGPAAAGATSSTSAPAPVESSTPPNAPAQMKPKKKSKFLFCCGGSGLD